MPRKIKSIEAVPYVASEDDAIIQKAIEILESRVLRNQDIIENPEDAYNLLRLKYASKDREHFVVLYLDNRHRILHYESLFQGTVKEALLRPREVLRHALLNNASAVILAHNHPSDTVEPSRADIDVTVKLKQLLREVDIELLDHFILTKDSYLSLAQRGHI